jgi:beta propeller repeat protein
MKKIIFLMVFIMVFLLAGAASAVTNPEPANPNPVVTSSAAIDGHQMVFEDSRWGDSDIYVKDLITSTTTDVSSVPTEDRNPDISGNIVVWQSRATSSSNWQIYYKNLSDYTGSHLVYSVPTYNQTDPKISGTYVVWKQGPYGTGLGGQPDDDIRGYDLTSSTYYSITNSIASETCPDVAGDTVVYQKYENLGSDAVQNWHWQVYKTHTTSAQDTGTKINGWNTDQLTPVISINGKAAWQEWNDYGASYNIGWVNNVWTDNFVYYEGTADQDEYPAIYGNILVWAQNTGGTNWNVYMRNLSNANPMIAVADSSIWQCYPAVGCDQYGIFVAYEEYISYYRVFWRNMDRTTPTVSSTNPAQYAVNLPSNQVFYVYFSELIKAKNLNLIILKTISGTVIPTTKSISGNVLTITPTIALAEAKYLLLIYSGSLTDYANNYVATQSRTYSVGNSPYVTSTSPSNYAVNVARNQVITATFNEPIVAKYLTLIYLKTTTGVIIATTKSVSGNVLTITPTSTLAAGTRYLLMIYYFAVTDLSGNPNVNKAISFTTGSS